MEHSQIPVFVIDDDESFLLLISRILEHNGFVKVKTANCGQKAMEKLHLPPYDKDTQTAVLMTVDSDGAVEEVEIDAQIIILDVKLPDTDGFELCKIIKRERPDAMVMLISGFDIENLQDQLIGSDADDFLTKPFNPDEFVARIELLFSKYRRLVQQRAKLNQSEATSGHQIPHIGDAIDDYFILDSLGWGKSSVIYKVMQQSTRETYALKLLTRYSLDFKEVVDRFNHEIELMKQFDHPNIIKLHTTGHYQRCPYIIMDYIHGTNLEEAQAASGTPDVDLVMTVALQTASALADIHKHGVLHRDIKPKNVMLDHKTGNVKLTDFGIAKNAEHDVNLTQDGLIVGTPIYMAPEVFRGDFSTVQSDIYSYGVTMYQYASGSPPFSAKSNRELSRRHAEDTPRPISSYNPSIPKRFDDLIIGWCMAKAPEDRPKSIGEVMDAIQELSDSIS